MNGVQTYEASLLNKKNIAKDTCAFYWLRPKDYTFFPGQYTTISLSIIPSDNLGASRDFTIASSPLEKKYIQIVTKKGKSDFKKALFSMKRGEKAQLTHPAGGFYLREDTTPRIFLAGGIGITPFYSMISAAIKKNHIPLTLFVSFSTVEDIIFLDELQKIAQENKHITIIYTVSRSGVSQKDWVGEKGRITKEIIKRYIPNILEPIYMIAGSEKMVEETQQILRDMEISEEKIKVDIFTGY